MTFTPKRSPASKNTKKTSKREQNKPPAFIYDCIFCNIRILSAPLRVDQCGWELCRDSTQWPFSQWEGRRSTVTGDHFLPVFSCVHACCINCWKTSFSTCTHIQLYRLGRYCGGNYYIEEMKGNSRASLPGFFGEMMLIWSYLGSK